MNHRLQIFLFAIFLFFFIERVEADNSEYKSLTTARLLSAVCPGAGEFYVHNYWKGVLDFGVEGVLVGGTILLVNAIEDAPELEAAAEGEMSKEDYRVLAWACGIGALGYYIFQIWRLNDDVVIYNYKKRFLKTTSLRFNFNSTKCTILLARNF